MRLSSATGRMRLSMWLSAFMWLDAIMGLAAFVGLPAIMGLWYAMRLSALMRRLSCIMLLLWRALRMAVIRMCSWNILHMMIIAGRYTGRVTRSRIPVATHGIHRCCGGAAVIRCNVLISVLRCHLHMGCLLGSRLYMPFSLE
jgi:hypothetical protein